jgi:RimJ/RimL family protein N-acetyltransferase
VSSRPGGPERLATPRLATPRLDLVPLEPGDADEMVGVLADPRLHVFVGGRPPTLEELRVRYARQAVGHAPDRRETWHNWIVRLRPSGDAVGFVQATVDDAGGVADVAWLIGVRWQGRGYATEAARRLVAWLEDRGVQAITAHVHPDHAASAAVARAVGLEPTDELEDGERTWRRGGRRDR